MKKGILSTILMAAACAGMTTACGGSPDEQVVVQEDTTQPDTLSQQDQAYLEAAIIGLDSLVDGESSISSMYNYVNRSISQDQVRSNDLLRQSILESGTEKIASYANSAFQEKLSNTSINNPDSVDELSAFVRTSLNAVKNLENGRDTNYATRLYAAYVDSLFESYSEQTATADNMTVDQAISAANMVAPILDPNTHPNQVMGSTNRVLELLDTMVASSVMRAVNDQVEGEDGISAEERQVLQTAVSYLASLRTDTAQNYIARIQEIDASVTPETAPEDDTSAEENEGPTITAEDGPSTEPADETEPEPEVPVQDNGEATDDPPRTTAAFTITHNVRMG